MNADEAKKIFTLKINDLPDDVKKAVEFNLDNWAKFEDMSKINSAKKFLVNLSALPLNRRNESKAFVDKLDKVVKILRNEPSVWYGVEDLPHEEWRNVIGYKDEYQVSNFGRVKSLKNGKTKILKGLLVGKGYHCVDLLEGGDRQRFLVHVLVAQAFIENSLGKPIVNHQTGDKLNNCIWNLEWNTFSENNKHAYQLGLKKVEKGLKNHCSKLTSRKVKYIRKFHKARDPKFGTRALAKKYHVAESTIYNIVHYLSYIDVK